MEQLKSPRPTSVPAEMPFSSSSSLVNALINSSAPSDDALVVVPVEYTNTSHNDSIVQAEYASIPVNDAEAEARANEAQARTAGAEVRAAEAWARANEAHTRANEVNAQIPRPATTSFTMANHTAHGCSG